MATNKTMVGNVPTQKLSMGIPNNVRNRRLPVWISPAANANNAPARVSPPSPRVDTKVRVRG